MDSPKTPSFKYREYKVGKLYTCPGHFPVVWPTLEAAVNQVKFGNRVWALSSDPASWVKTYSEMLGIQNQLQYFDGNYPALLVDKYEMTYWSGLPLLHFLAPEASGWVLPLEIFVEVNNV